MQNHILAGELNKRLDEINPAIFKSLSAYAKRLYFPKGIITQAEEAKEKAHLYNATIGVAMSNKQLITIPEISDHYQELGTNFLNYSPTRGLVELREEWKKHLIENNPTLKNKKISLPLVTHAITHAVSTAADLFADQDDSIIIPEHYWGNYNMIFQVRHGVDILKYPTFNQRNTYNIEGLLDTIKRAAEGNIKIQTILNFPNNPTGYTLYKEELEELKAGLLEFAQKGYTLVIYCDDAYQGLFFENTVQESVFAHLCDLHPNIIAIKCDGATKEMFAWGLRIGFLTFGIGSPHAEEIYEILSKKAAGAIRATISSASTPGQWTILNTLKNPNWKVNQKKSFDEIKVRYQKIKTAIQDPKYRDLWVPYPFNSGYFLTIRLNGVDAETLRIYLLDHAGIGTISTGPFDLRIAFACVEDYKIADLVEKIANSARQLKKS